MTDTGLTTFLVINSSVAEPLARTICEQIKLWRAAEEGCIPFKVPGHSLKQWHIPASLC